MYQAITAQSKQQDAKLEALVKENQQLKEALKNMVNLSYQSARPTRAEIDHNIGVAEKLLYPSK